MKTIKLLFASCITYLLFISCAPWEVPTHLVGNWQAKQKVTVRQKQNGKFVFIAAPDSIPVKFSIDKDGKVSGQIGNATFENCKVVKNRGDLGRKLNLATDYVIKGELNGAIFEGDPNLKKEISAPFDVNENKMKGSLFQMFGIDLYPMTGMDAMREK